MRSLISALAVLALTTPAFAGNSIDGGRGPVPVHVPPSYDGTPAPLVFLLHGYTASAASVESWLQLTPLADEMGFIYVVPNGSTDCFGNRFWNATDACCNVCDSGIDDSSYLRALVEAAESTWSIDPRRIYFAGHSNGGFMSYRMACDHADLIAAVASIAGAATESSIECTPVGPVHTLQVHGTSDTVISYNGGCLPFLGCYPSAVETVEQWAGHDGCAINGVPGAAPLDLVSTIGGAETQVLHYEQQCAPGGSSTLWTINGGAHSPAFNASFRDLLIEFLYDHPKPALCPADTNGSGTVDVDDLVAVILAWGDCAGACAADIDGNGVVDVDDLVAVVVRWGAC